MSFTTEGGVTMLSLNSEINRNVDAWSKKLTNNLNVRICFQ